MAKTLILFCLLVVLVGFSGLAVSGQTTAFSYQGSLIDSSTPANGNFDFEFRLFSALSGGSQAGATLTRNNVAVANGVFSVSLDFGANFPGADRFLEIAVKPAGGGAFTPLAPRSQILSAPYAIKSALAENATNAVTAATVTGPITGSNIGAMLHVTNTHPGIMNPSPTNLPPAALKGETTSTVNGAVGVLGISANGAGVVGLSNGNDSSGVVGIGTGSGDSFGVDAQSLSPNGTAVSAEMPGGGSGFLFVGRSDSQTQFSVRSNGNVEIRGALSVIGTAQTQGAFTPFLLSGGTDTICRAAGSNTLRLCSSSLRYKKQIQPFNGGLALLNRLRPISFAWKEGNTNDFGLGAEDVAAIEPLLVTYNSKGEVEGVKYDRIGVVLINAVKEQQAQIEQQAAENRELRAALLRQKERLDTQQADIDTLKAIVCAGNTAATCRSPK